MDFRLRHYYNHCKVICLMLSLLYAQPINQSKVKRGFFNFGKMILEVTGKNPFDFNNYGNFCGLGGGGKAVDPIDHCCEIHDACYGYVEGKSECPTSTLILMTKSYKYELVNETIVCDAKNNDKCSQISCICDKTLCECFKAFIHLYNSKNKS